MDELSLHAAFVQLSAALAPAAHAVRGVEDVALLDARGRVLAQPLIAGLDLPDSYADRWYTLREHLAAARARLLNLRAR